MDGRGRVQLALTLTLRSTTTLAPVDSCSHITSEWETLHSNLTAMSDRYCCWPHSLWGPTIIFRFFTKHLQQSNLRFHCLLVVQATYLLLVRTILVILIVAVFAKSSTASATDVVCLHKLHALDSRLSPFQGSRWTIDDVFLSVLMYTGVIFSSRLSIIVVYCGFYTLTHSSQYPTDTLTCFGNSIPAEHALYCNSPPGVFPSDAIPGVAPYTFIRQVP